MAGNLGGARPGAGRPKGAIARRNEEAIKKAEAEGIMPRDLLLKDMRYYDTTAESEIARLQLLPQTAENIELLKIAISYKKLARDCAEAVAPYCHSKLSSVDQTVTMNTHEDALAELE